MISSGQTGFLGQLVCICVRILQDLLQPIHHLVDLIDDILLDKCLGILRRSVCCLLYKVERDVPAIMGDVVHPREADDVPALCKVVLHDEAVRKDIYALIAHAQAEIRSGTVPEVGAELNPDIIGDLILEVRPAEGVRRIHADSRLALHTIKGMRVVLRHNEPLGLTQVLLLKRFDMFGHSLRDVFFEATAIFSRLLLKKILMLFSETLS